MEKREGLGEEMREESGVEAAAEQGSADVDTERLGRLPIEALLYYVLYGDEGLMRLT